MAKRKRLSPLPVLEPGTERAPETKALKDGWAGTRTAPIADVAGRAATQAALDEVAGEIAAARKGGRLVQRIVLDAIDETHLVRDRAVVDADDMASLTASLKARGQQTPLEVVELGQGRYGLISGWRRLMALRGLEDVDTALCLLRAPQSASEAYLAMVEENEIRSNLSFYERARIASRAAEQGAYPTARHAVKGLFANVSASKRSKINSFIAVYDALDEVLRFPAALSERQGLALSRALETDTAMAARMREALQDAAVSDAAQEQEMLSKLMQGGTPDGAARPAAKTPPRKDPVPQGIRVEVQRGQVRLTGAGVTGEFAKALQEWVERYEASS